MKDVLAQFVGVKGSLLQPPISSKGAVALQQASPLFWAQAREVFELFDGELSDGALLPGTSLRGSERVIDGIEMVKEIIEDGSWPSCMGAFVPWIHTTAKSDVGFVAGEGVFCGQIIEVDYEMGVALPLAVTLGGFLRAFMSLSLRGVEGKSYYHLSGNDMAFLRGCESILNVRGDPDASWVDIWSLC